MADVAPHAGAWVETSRYRASISSRVSPPTRGRGLKHLSRRLKNAVNESPPTRGRGLKRQGRCHQD